MNEQFLDQCRKQAKKSFNDDLKRITDAIKENMIETLKEEWGYYELVHKVEDHHTGEWIDKNLGFLEDYEEALEKELCQPIIEKIKNLDLISLLKNQG